MRHLSAAFLSLLAGLLAACSSRAFTSTPYLTLALTPHVTLTPTFIRPTATTRPSTTATELSATPTSTPLPPPTATFSPFDYADSTLTSPDGKWTAYFFGLYVALLRVTNADRSILWEIDEDDFAGYEAVFAPYRWSQDSRYLYFTIHLFVDGYVPFYDGVGLRQLDVTTGEVADILPSGDETKGEWLLAVFSLSPNDQLLAYTTLVETQLRLVIRDLTTKRERRLWLPNYSNAGNIIWSPTQDRLVFALTKGDNWDNTLFSLVQVHVVDLSSQVLIQDDPRRLDPVAWADNNEVVIRERGGLFFYLDLNTREWRAGPTITPFP